MCVLCFVVVSGGVEIIWIGSWYGLLKLWCVVYFVLLLYSDLVGF